MNAGSPHPASPERTPPLIDDGIAFRELGPSDLGEVVALHCRVLESLPDRGHLYARTAAHFERVLGGEGCMVGAIDAQGGLVGYSSVLRHDATDCTKLALSHLPLPPTDIVQGAGLVVDPQHRGKALMARMTEARRALGLHLGARFSTGIVSIRNLPSLRNMHSGHYIGAGTHHDEDSANLLFLKALTEDLVIPATGDMDLCLVDLDAQLSALATCRFIALPAHMDDAGPVWRFIAANRLPDVLCQPGSQEPQREQVAVTGR